MIRYPGGGALALPVAARSFFRRNGHGLRAAGWSLARAAECPFPLHLPPKVCLMRKDGTLPAKKAVPDSLSPGR